MSAITSQGLTLSYQDSVIIDQLNVSVPKGKVTVLIGGNGSGKSTLLKSFARLLKPQQGTVLLNGVDIQRKATATVARELAILPQTPVAPEGISVRQLVALGRYPYQSWLQQWSDEDETMVNRALARTGTLELADRPVDSLSGGQRQRAWIAMTLAQDTDIVVLDEPTTFLDLSHQMEVLELLRELNQQEQKTIVMVLHDLNLACRYADQILVVHEQTIYAQGTPAEVLTEELVKTVFDLNCRIIPDPFFDTPLCIPFGREKIE
ncbi:ABC transporter ATP-binding protein [Oceanospirillum sediminis]|uniref:ABC transporter ATP-binding protein n=1 Tax=Oceanospirillum sediminis TaxID=2760088 RepID=A0A839IUX2_9GAMM|nr:ABC transporter ATP-binding protein [Oceanospirillum sediminis]MBB1489145.1 ABC transporter ATP-binding protein [Oceanospirillum sediminis]